MLSNALPSVVASLALILSVGRCHHNVIDFFWHVVGASASRKPDSSDCDWYVRSTSNKWVHTLWRFLLSCVVSITCAECGRLLFCNACSA